MSSWERDSTTLRLVMSMRNLMRRDRLSDTGPSTSLGTIAGNRWVEQEKNRLKIGRRQSHLCRRNRSDREVGCAEGVTVRRTGEVTVGLWEGKTTVLPLACGLLAQQTNRSFRYSLWIFLKQVLLALSGAHWAFGSSCTFALSHICYDSRLELSRSSWF